LELRGCKVSQMLRNQGFLVTYYWCLNVKRPRVKGHGSGVRGYCRCHVVNYVDSLLHCHADDSKMLASSEDARYYCVWCIGQLAQLAQPAIDSVQRQTSTISCNPSKFNDGRNSYNGSISDDSGCNFRLLRQVSFRQRLPPGGVMTTNVDARQRVFQQTNPCEVDRRLAVPREAVVYGTVNRQGTKMSTGYWPTSPRRLDIDIVDHVTAPTTIDKMTDEHRSNDERTSIIDRRSWTSSTEIDRNVECDESHVTPDCSTKQFRRMSMAAASVTERHRDVL